MKLKIGDLVKVMENYVREEDFFWGVILRFEPVSFDGYHKQKAWIYWGDDNSYAFEDISHLEKLA